MADDGDNYIEFSDLEQRPDGTYYFSLLSNRPNLIMNEGLGLIDVYGNGYSLTGSGNVGFDLGTTNYGVDTFDLNITGTFRYGAYGAGLNGSRFVNVDVSNSSYLAMHLDGDDMLIRYSDITNIGSDTSHEIIGGISAIGSRITIDQTTVSGLRSAVETYAIGFNEYGGVDCLLSNSTLGYGSGWGFPVWDRTTGSEIYNTVAYGGWSSIVGSVYGIDITWSTFEAAWTGATWTADPTSSITTTGYDTPVNGWITGTSGHEHLGGTAAADTINGLAGNDVMAGFGGADTFVFFPAAGESDVAIDFVAGTDRIDVNIYTFADRLEFGAATGAGACMVWDEGINLLYLDTNGNLPGGADTFIYLPYGDNLTAADLIF